MSSMNVYTHYDLTSLAEKFAKDIKVRHENADYFAPEYLIVQTAGMKRWLALECAKQNSVFANVTSMMPRQFIKRLGFILLNEKETATMFDSGILTWTLFKIISKDLEKNTRELDDIRAYLGAKDIQMKLFSLCEKVADIMDQYMLYRSDWLKSWEQGERLFTENNAEIWQSYLWRRIIEENAGTGIANPVDLPAALIDKLKLLSDKEKELLPKRLSLFGMSLLPPEYYRVFSQLAKVIDVSLYLQVPTIAFMGDTLSDKQVQWRVNNIETFRKLGLENTYKENRLLRNFGITSKEFMNLILDQDVPTELYDLESIVQKDSEHLSLLNRVQTDIIICKDTLYEPLPVPEDDWSIRLASCYTPLREVEVLHDLLLDCFSKDATLSPSDVLIVTPDIVAYSPYIAMVFEDAAVRCGTHIPYSIADQSLSQDHLFLRFVEDCLHAATQRFEASRIVPLFERSMQLQVNPLSANDRNELVKWCTNSGIRWGYDQQHRISMGFTDSDAFTFRKGVDRLIAGYVMDDDELLDSGLYPVVAAEGSNAELLGRFAEFIDSFAALVMNTGSSMPIDEWNGLVASMIRNIFGTGDDTEETDSANGILHNIMMTMRERSVISGVGDQRIPFPVYLRGIRGLLETSDAAKGFFTGAVTVAGMVPMRSIPFRIVAMLGMNRGLFPRQSRQPLFDLMTIKPRNGDRNLLHSDRYLFLESILSAKERLIMTWTGFEVDSGKVTPPSVLINEFIDHLNREYRASDGTKSGESVTVQYPLQPFSQRYRSAKQEDQKLNTWNRSLFREDKDKRFRDSLFQWKNTRETAINDSIVNGNTIIETLCDPISSFLQSCGISSDAYDRFLEDSEPFTMTGMSGWQTREAIGKEIFDKDAAALSLLQENAVIPDGIGGEMMIDEQRRKLKSRIELMQSIIPEPLFGKYRVNEKIGAKQYCIECDKVALSVGGTERRALIAEFGDVKLENNFMRADKILKSWIRHIFLNLEMQTATTLVALDKTIKFSSMDKKAAKKIIDSLAALSLQNMISLIPFFPELSLYLFENLADMDTTRSKLWEKLEVAFGRGYNGEENLDIWMRGAFEDADSWDEAISKIPNGEKSFITTAEEVFIPMKQYMTEGQ